jgi:hypothetical protein
MSKTEIGRVKYSFLCKRLATAMATALGGANPCGGAQYCGGAHPFGGELDPDPFMKIANMRTRQKDILDMGFFFLRYL